jgi:hypothetical protein
MAKKAAAPTLAKVQLIVSDEPKPAVTLEPGMRFEVISVPLVGPSLRPESAAGARLCGGTSTCLALVQIEAEQR